MTAADKTAELKPVVGLFVTCLVDLFRPTVGFAAVKLLEAAGCTVRVPEGQSCCGQPAYNSGARAQARAVARTVLDAFADVDYVVAPSGSCAGMIRHHYPALFADDPADAGRAAAVAAKTWELVSFLTDVRGLELSDVRFDGAVAYHDSCSGLRELGIDAAPRALLGAVEGLTLREAEDREVCCGFGGTFCVKYPDISGRMVADKVRALAATGAGTVLAGDLGCLMNIAGRMRREGRAMEARHIAEVLAGMADGPAIGRAENEA
ncbi:MAG: (Fe-S)-binding protein [Rhodospirillaceae bacterium]|jgi:L-lactate dehydrogenase complex protein LldE|nr:(Fe-S)-binding protein [Rhodospirillaceae bacterium]MBT6118000.1 (Fe-S)-binding protein [Rhodospirillaceae bacterium]